MKAKSTQGKKIISILNDKHYFNTMDDWVRYWAVASYCIGRGNRADAY